MASRLKFWIQKVEERYYACYDNKRADRLQVTGKLISAFVVSYAKCYFSHDIAPLYSVLCPFQDYFSYIKTSIKSEGISHPVLYLIFTSLIRNSGL